MTLSKPGWTRSPWAVTAATALLLAGAALPAPGQDVAAARKRARDNARILQTAVARLGARAWHERREADRLLRAMGPAALPELASASVGPDPEIRFAALRILLSSPRTAYFVRQVAGRTRPGSAPWRCLAHRREGNVGAGELNSRRAVEMLGYFGGTRALTFLVDRLLAAPYREWPSAAVALSHLRDDDAAAKALASRWDGAAYLARRRIIHALGKVCSEKSRSFLEGLKTNPNHTLRYDARNALNLLAARFRARQALVKIAAGDTDPAYWRQVRTFLTNLATGLDQFVSDLSCQTDPAARARVLRFFRSFSDAGGGREKGKGGREGAKSFNVWGIMPPYYFAGPAGEPWIPVLAKALEETESEDEKYWILGILAEHPRSDLAAEALARSFVAPLLGDHVQHLCESLCEPLAPYLGAVAREAHPRMRRRILHLLADHGGHFSAAELATFLGEEGDAADLLARMDSALVVPHLKAGLAHPAAARHCAAILGRLGREAGFVTLARVVERGYVSAEVVEGLGLTRDERAFPLLVRYLRDVSFAPAALRGLVHLGDPRARRAFTAYLSVRPMAATALDGLEAVGTREDAAWVRLFLASYRFRSSEVALHDKAQAVLEMLLRR